MENCNPYKIAESYAEDIMLEREYWSEDDLFDICHEHADGSGWVIYYSRAHEFVRALSGDDESSAVDQCHDMGEMPQSYDDWAVKIAYFALVDLIMAAVQTKLDEIDG